MIEVFKNSYVSLETADYYFDERLNSSVWDNATQEEKEKALVTASKKLDNLNFIGSKKSQTQPMAFPRLFVSDKVTQMPADIEEAVCEEALALLEFGNSVHTQNKNFGIQSISLGTGSVSYRETKQEGLLSAEAYRLVSKWLCKGFDIAKPEFVEVD